MPPGTSLAGAIDSIFIILPQIALICPTCRQDSSAFFTYPIRADIWIFLVLHADIEPCATGRDHVHHTHPL